MLLMEVRREFHLVSRNCLIRTMEDMGAYGDLMRWKGSFIFGRSVGMFINGNQSTEAELETRVP